MIPSISRQVGILDSHTFLWWDGDPKQLSPAVLSFCTDPNNTLLISIASVWEIAIKVRLGKLTLRDPLPEIVGRQGNQGVRILNIKPEHIYALDTLPMLHKDPFDRLLIAQAQFEGAILLTADASVAAYPIVTLW